MLRTLLRCADLARPAETIVFPTSVFAPQIMYDGCVTGTHGDCAAAVVTERAYKRTAQGRSSASCRTVNSQSPHPLRKLLSI